MAPSILQIRPLGFQWETRDPFLFCVYHADEYPKGNGNFGPDEALLMGRQIGSDFRVKDGWRMYHGEKIPGFPAHPHRGFETVTIVQRGLIDHSDSLGAAARFGNGDVQWMTAGKGVMHSEMFPLLNEKDNNPLELFQIWLNLPKEGKMVPAHFKMLWHENIPIVKFEDSTGKQSTIKVIAGEFQNEKPLNCPPHSWAATTTNNVAIWMIECEAGATVTLPATAAGVNRSLYFFEGDSMQLDGTTVKAYQAIDLVPTATITLTAGDTPCRFLLLQGKPIAQPMVQYGPFVMNTEAEIQEAYHDFQKTRFGGWPWPTYEYVHSKEKGRFALHADGTLEEK